MSPYVSSFGTQSFDRDHFVSLVSNFRESLGFEAADTESTFDPWDVVSLETSGLDMHDGKPNYAWLNMWDYWMKLPKHVLEPIALMHSVRGTRNYASQQRARHAASYFYMVFMHVFPDEWETLPLYACRQYTKSALGKMRVKHGFCVNTIRDKAMFFDKILAEVYPDGLTFHDWRQMTNGNGHNSLSANLSVWQRIRCEHPWFPHVDVLFSTGHHPKGENFRSPWDFIHQFQQHINRDAKGRFTARTFKRLDHLVHEYGNKGGKTNLSKWNRYHVRDWLFDYAFKHYAVVVNRETFPERATEDELEQIINLRSIELKHIAGGSKVYRHMQENMDDSGNSILKMVQYAWPKYDMTLSRWSRATAGEKRANIMLERVFAYHGEHYSHGTSTPLFDGEGNKMTYNHLLNRDHHDIKVDGRSDSLRFALESQGDWHFIDLREAGQRYDGTMYYRTEIPAAYLEWCAAEGIEPETTMLDYRQKVLDPECRRAIESIGYTPVYLMLSDFSYAVEGVHGDIPIWSGTYVTPEGGFSRHDNRIGLAETFDLQGRTDIGDMIREYWEAVVR